MLGRVGGGVPSSPFLPPQRISTAALVEPSRPPVSTSSMPAPPSSPLPAPSQEPLAAPPVDRGKILIFTMDSIAAREAERKAGGPGGEQLVRVCFEEGLRELGFEVQTMTSDEQFAAVSHDTQHIGQYKAYVLDPWTVFDPGWVPRAFLNGRMDKLFIMDFFGQPALDNRLPGMQLNQFLSPYPDQFGNTFLGFFLPERNIDASKRTGEGILWGKKPDYFNGPTVHATIKRVSEIATLHTSLPSGSGVAVQLGSNNIVHHGAVGREEWYELMLASDFLLGLGDPISGPSAIEAVSLGLMYINPSFASPREIKAGVTVTSQHPYAASLGPDAVCTYPQGDLGALEACVRRAVERTEVRSMLPEAYKRAVYMERLKKIMSRF